LRKISVRSTRGKRNKAPRKAKKTGGPSWTINFNRVEMDQRKLSTDPSSHWVGVRKRVLLRRRLYLLIGGGNH